MIKSEILKLEKLKNRLFKNGFSFHIDDIFLLKESLPEILILLQEDNEASGEK